MSAYSNSNAGLNTIAALLPKLSDADADFRFMSLNDIYNVLSNGQASFLSTELNIAARAVDGILKTLDDQNGEVQNLALKCLGPLSARVPPSILSQMLERLARVNTQNSVDSSIPSTALRTVITSLPRPTPGLSVTKAAEESYISISRVLVPALIGNSVVQSTDRSVATKPVGLLVEDSQKHVEAESVDVLIELIRCFGPLLQDAEVRALQRTVTNILESDKTGSVAKKRAVIAISVLAVYFRDGHLSAFVSELIQSFRDPHLTQAKRRLLITVVGSLARATPRRFGPYLQTLAPFILSALSQAELDDQMADLAEAGETDSEAEDVREAALVAIENCLSSRSAEIRPFTPEIIEAALRFLKYDPNVANNEDDEEMGGTQGQEVKDAADGGLDHDSDEEDFEEDDAFSDDDDVSWKIRRCAAKVLYALITTRGKSDLLEDGTIYSKVAPTLVERFREREENVRLEILAAMSAVVRNTGEGETSLDPRPIDEANTTLMGPPRSRKRRRGGSDASMFDTQASVFLSAGIVSPAPSATPTSGPRASLANLSPAIVRSVARLLDRSSVSTKQASIALLKDIVAVQHGGISEHLHQIIGPVVDAIKATNLGSSGASSATAAGGAASATGSSLRIAALAFTAAISETHPLSVLVPHLGKLVPAVTLTVKDKYFKVSSEALNVVEQFVKLLTPPRCPAPDEQIQGYLESLYDTIIYQVSATDAGFEVRHQAIHALGILLARTSGQGAVESLTQAKRLAGLEVIQERLKNETTRIAAVRAIDTIASVAKEKSELQPAWVRAVALELGAQLRKADRLLRGASLGALKNLVVQPAGHENLDGKTTKELVVVLSPLLGTTDLHLLGPALVVLASLVKGNAKKVVDAPLIDALCSLVVAPLGGAVLDALLILVRTIGEEGVGQQLMQKLLKDVGVNGDPAIVGKVVGTLVVFGGGSVGVRVENFRDELLTAQDDKRKCLALSVMGEAGLQLGLDSTLDPKIFIDHFKSNSTQVQLAAAIALGRAGAGNVAEFLPVILEISGRAGKSQYLLLHSIKEILQHASDTETDIAPFSQRIWDNLMVTAQEEDTKAVGAECIGRLAIVDPESFVPTLQTYLENEKPSVRGMIIQAVRYTLADTDDSYDHVLEPILVGMLTTMLNDSAVENRRLALTTLNSAIQNKANLVLDGLDRILPLVLDETLVKADLVREVQMGPFKHKVDDGLELRKSAYETLYVLMESAFSRTNHVDFFDRVIAGLGDEHDIKVLCSIMLGKLVVLDPAEASVRLDSISENFRSILSFTPKDGSVKQELEKAEEARRSVLRVSIKINGAFPAATTGYAASVQNQAWHDYWEWARKDFATALREIDQELSGQYDRKQ
ncbi:MAG: hypothetical protein M1825_002002 [Sarcosagium campestre]|nr:MAG: hypothetical protein M1825_002002 [Sarcosagium campestre]